MVSSNTGVRTGTGWASSGIPRRWSALLWLVLAVTFLCVAIGSGAVLWHRSLGPVLLVESPNRKLPPAGGSRLAPRVQFQLTNGGTSPLRIERITTSCGCLLIDRPKDILQPGERSVLRVSAGRPLAGGPSTVTVAIKSNCRVAPIKVLRLTGFSERTPPFVKRTSDRVVLAGDLTLDATTDFWIQTIERKQDDPWLKELSCPLSFLRIESGETGESPFRENLVQRTYSFTIRVLSLPEPGDYEDVIRVPDESGAKLPLHVHVPHALHAEPSVLFASLDGQRSSADFKLAVSRRTPSTGTRMRIATEPAQLVAATPDVGQSGDIQQLSVTASLPPMSKTLLGRVHIHDDELATSLIVPVVVFRRSQ